MGVIPRLPRSTSSRPVFITQDDFEETTLASITEWEFTAEVASWINSILEKDSRLPFSTAKCEQRGSGSQKRRDLTLLDKTQQVCLTGRGQASLSPRWWQSIQHRSRQGRTQKSRSGQSELFLHLERQRMRPLGNRAKGRHLASSRLPVLERSQRSSGISPSAPIHTSADTRLASPVP